MMENSNDDDDMIRWLILCDYDENYDDSIVWLPYGLIQIQYLLGANRLSSETFVSVFVKRALSYEPPRR